MAQVSFLYPCTAPRLLFFFVFVLFWVVGGFFCCFFWGGGGQSLAGWIVFSVGLPGMGSVCGLHTAASQRRFSAFVTDNCTLYCVMLIPLIDSVQWRGRGGCKFPGTTGFFSFPHGRFPLEVDTFFFPAGTNWAMETGQRVSEEEVKKKKKSTRATIITTGHLTKLKL